jgi:hypothetical protein
MVRGGDAVMLIVAILLLLVALYFCITMGIRAATIAVVSTRRKYMFAGRDGRRKMDRLWSVLSFIFVTLPILILISALVLAGVGVEL